MARQVHDEESTTEAGAGFSADAIAAARRALAASGGRQAQFSHPELGGLGQWSPGMVMIGDMFNRALAARVGVLFASLSADAPAVDPVGERGSSVERDAWWPVDLGTPSSTGAQNDAAYAFFAEHRRLAIRRHGRVTLYDTGEHRISGFGQQGGSLPLCLSGAAGPIALDDLTALPDTGASVPSRAGATSGDPLEQLDRLAALHRRGVIDDGEFASKKKQLLERV